MKLAARGQRDMDSGPETITDSAQLRQVRRQARIVHAKSLAAALVITVVIYFL